MRARATELLVVGLVALWGCGNPVVTREKGGYDVSEGGAEPSEGGNGNEVPPLLNEGGAAGSESVVVTAGSGQELLCGNAHLDEGESCDDGNAVPGDGCDGKCRVESGYECKDVGEKCVSTLSCGDGKPGPNEACDDGNTKNDDGCSSKCTVEPGYQCLEFGKMCVPKSTTAEPECGNGAVEEGESCDDGNTESDDGCSSTCATEDGWICQKAGQPCARDEYCGDGVLNGDEECDDGNTRAGDCCNGTCVLEPNCSCRTPSTPTNPPHQICSSTVVCGDGKVTGSEACDDGNKDSDDGCSSDCNNVEPGYKCPSGGGPCTVAVVTCGNAKLDPGEQCDDGQDPMKSGDGCSADCKVEPGYICPTAGAKCTLKEYCGDGKVSFVRGETCDDGVDPDTGEPADGDGCSASCTVEPFWHCTGEPSECVYTVKCGDKKRTGDETCDDGNQVSGDGCDGETCQVEEGWSCPVVGAACRPICGDGLVRGREQCDDSNLTAGDGCGITCQLEPGWVCPAGAPCRPTVCGDGVKEGSERCDDGNLHPYDGCAPDCVLEPECGTADSAVGVCTSKCGDGILLTSSGEQCDDGNSVSGDGCSSSCKQEQGYLCTSTLDAPPDAVDIPIVYRDFERGWDNAGDPITGANPDFEEPFTWDGGSLDPMRVPDIVESTLGADRKPVYAGTDADPVYSTHGQTYFDQWYRDVSINQRFDDSIHLVNDGTGSYSMDSRYDAPWDDLGGFFPLDDRGFGNSGQTQAGVWHNFHFTSELRYWFEYKGSERLDFSGDDDVFVFINGHLAIDLGGVHGRLVGSVLLDASTGHGSACSSGNFNAQSCTPAGDIDFGLELGQIYETVVFQAERHTFDSNYWLTLTNFTAGRSTCGPVCGDGFVTPDEACDLGEDKNTGAYGGCYADCTLAPYCGDGTVDTGVGEKCDDGANTTVYGKTGCAPGCVKPPYCGDGKADTDFGETCDLGADNQAGAYGPGACTNTCQTAPFCGDGFKNGSEQCDEGPDNGTVGSVCDAECRFTCGNGQLDPGEQCDDGAANKGQYGGCRSDCRLAPYCGDGVKNGTEQCDDGKNDGSYGTCAPGCKLAPYCGDGDIDSGAGETCDDGEDNGSVDYGDEDACSTRCLPPPYCGDGVVDVAFGEVCDDGEDNGNDPGQCKPDCSGYNKPPVTCGNGKLDAGEQCDDGADNGSKSSPCDVRCQLKCGNGFKDPGEECDDGTNDGSYGTCRPDCTIGEYCGDGTKNGPEQCDLGGDNEASPYGKGKCTTQCTLAPYCGDGRLQSKYEACDGQSGCGANCGWIT